MKKLIILLCFLIIGCSKPTIYDQYVSTLKKETVVSETVPFDVNIYVDDFNEEKWIYQVVIDKPQEQANNIKALVVHNVKTKDIFPSVGIVDEPVHFDDKTKGINLVGYVDKSEHLEFKILIETDNNKYIVQYKYR